MTQYDGPPDLRVSNDSELTPEQSESDEDDLRAGLSGLAGLVGGARGVNELLTEVAQFAAQAIPGVEGLGVTVLQPSDGKKVRSSAARDEPGATRGTTPLLRHAMTKTTESNTQGYE